MGQRKQSQVGWLLRRRPGFSVCCACDPVLSLPRCLVFFDAKVARSGGIPAAGPRTAANDSAGLSSHGHLQFPRSFKLSGRTETARPGIQARMLHCTMRRRPTLHVALAFDKCGKHVPCCYEVVLVAWWARLAGGPPGCKVDRFRMILHVFVRRTRPQLKSRTRPES